MLETLKSKIEYWTPARANSFYSNLVRSSQYAGMIYEQTPTGWYFYSSEKAGYYDLNGKSYILQLHTEELAASLDAQKVYSDYADANNLIKIEKPTLTSTTRINDVQYIYYEMSRPYNSHGIPQLNLCYVPESEIIATATEESKMAFKKADELFQLIDACEGTLYPKELNTENLLYDPATGNYFWAGDIVFSDPREYAIETHMTMFGNLSTYLSLILNKNMNIQNAVSNYINSECLILQLPT